MCLIHSLIVSCISIAYIALGKLLNIDMNTVVTFYILINNHSNCSLAPALSVGCGDLATSGVCA